MQIISWLSKIVRRRRPLRVSNSSFVIKKGINKDCHMKTKKEELVIGHVGNKVLPITDTAQTSSSATIKDNDQGRRPSSDKKEKTKGDKTKTLSRMKELLRWAAAARTTERSGKYINIGRKVLNFRNRAGLKALPDGDQLTNDSPKISFRWDLESCSTMTSISSSVLNQESRNLSSTPLHVRDEYVARKGNWIMTDSEFVVLELEL